MQLRLPWLISRRRLLIAIVIDCLLFGLSYGVAFQARFGVWPGFYLPLTWLLEVWLVASYVLGRYYDAKDASKAFFLRQCLGTLWVTLLSAAGYLFYHWLSASAQDAAVYRSLLLPFLLSFGLLSLLSQFALNEVLRNHLSESQKWLVLGTAEQAAHLSSLLTWSRLNTRLEHCSTAALGKLTDCQAGFSLVVPNIENLPAPLQPQLIQLQSNGLEIFSVFGWSERVLQRFPPDLLTFSDLLRGEFSISKNSFQLRLKRLGDVGVSLILLVLSSPLLLLAALLIRLEDG